MKIFRKQYSFQTHKSKEDIISAIFQKIEDDRNDRSFLFCHIVDYKSFRIERDRVEVERRPSAVNPFKSIGTIKYQFIPVRNGTNINVRLKYISGMRRSIDSLNSIGVGELMRSLLSESANIFEVSLNRNDSGFYISDITNQSEGSTVGYMSGDYEIKKDTIFLTDINRKGNCFIYSGRIFGFPGEDGSFLLKKK